MKLWLISQNQNDGYDTYDSAVVAAPTAEFAKTIHPAGSTASWNQGYLSWCESPSLVTAREIGEATEGIEGGTVILASFNAG